MGNVRFKLPDGMQFASNLLNDAGYPREHTPAKILNKLKNLNVKVLSTIPYGQGIAFLVSQEDYDKHVLKNNAPDKTFNIEDELNKIFEKLESIENYVRNNA